MTVTLNMTDYFDGFAFMPHSLSSFSHVHSGCCTSSIRRSSLARKLRFNLLIEDIFNLEGRKKNEKITFGKTCNSDSDDLDAVSLFLEHRRRQKGRAWRTRSIWSIRSAWGAWSTWGTWSAWNTCATTR
jgi:hypothetical protein